MEAVEALRLAAGVMFWLLADVFLVLVWAGVLVIIIGGIVKWIIK